MDPDGKAIEEELGEESVFRLYYTIFKLYYIVDWERNICLINRKKILKSCHYNGCVNFGQLYYSLGSGLYQSHLG